MEENSAHWLALREAGRRILVENDLIISVPQQYVPLWQRFMLNIADSMPQRLEFPSVQEGRFMIKKNDRSLFSFDTNEPEDRDVLWLPFDESMLLSELVQMCSELLLAGYPGCSGCGYQNHESEWDENAHRNRLKFSEQ